MMTPSRKKYERRKKAWWTFEKWSKKSQRDFSNIEEKNIFETDHEMAECQKFDIINQENVSFGGEKSR